MMLEKDATSGTKLHALLTSCLLERPFEETLSNMAGQSGEWWDKKADEMVGMLGEAVVEGISRQDNIVPPKRRRSND